MILKIINDLKTNVPANLLNHILSVTLTAYDLAIFYNVNEYDCIIAALLHDFVKKNDLDYGMIKDEDKSKYLEENKEIWHGYIASYLAKEKYNIDNLKIIEAIKYHTTGCKDMNDVGKILFIADTIEPLRNFEGIDYLQKKEKTLDEHFIKVVKHSLKYLEEKQIIIGPDTKEMKKQLNI